MIITLVVISTMMATFNILLMAAFFHLTRVNNDLSDHMTQHITEQKMSTSTLMDMWIEHKKEHLQG